MLAWVANLDDSDASGDGAGDGAADAAAAPAAQAIAPAVGAPPVAVARRRGRRLGHLASAETRLRQSRGRVRCLAKQARQDANELAQSVSMPLAVHAASVTFGGTAMGSAVVAGEAGTGHVESSARGMKMDQRKCRDLAVLSHMNSQALGLSAFVARANVCLFSVNIMDDASMWVRRPPEQAENAARRGLDNIAKRLRERGKNQHKPVLNLCESLHTVSLKMAPQAEAPAPGLSYELRCATVVSPAIVLPEQNATTIRDRWRLWSCNHVLGTGARVDTRLLGPLHQAVWQAPWRTIIVVRDNLFTNDVIIGLEERELACLRASEAAQNNVPTLLSISCAAHSAVLTMRPLMKSELFAGMDTFLVRLGHSLESGRLHGKYVDALAKLAKRRFRFIPVRAFSEETVQNMRKNESFLRTTRPARDLSRQDEADIIASLNGDWEDTEHVTHVCCLGQCPPQVPQR